MVLALIGRATWTVHQNDCPGFIDEVFGDLVRQYLILVIQRYVDRYGGTRLILQPVGVCPPYKQLLEYRKSGQLDESPPSVRSGGVYFNWLQIQPSSF